MKSKFLYIFLLIFIQFKVVAQITPSGNIVCPSQNVTYGSSTTYSTYKWIVVGGTPSSSTSSTINVTWGTANRGSISLEGFNLGISQGVQTQKIYINQQAIYTPTPNPAIFAGQSVDIGLTFANKSIKLNGSTDYVGIANSNLINLGVTDYRTVMLWFKANDITTRQVLYNEGGGSNGFSMYIEGGKVYCLAWEGGNGGVWNAPNASIVTGQWYHIAFVFDKDATDGYHFKGYLNGVNIGQFNEGSKADNGMSSHSGPVAIGSNSNIRFLNNSTSANNYFNGKIDGFKLWNRSLTQPEIAIEKDHMLNPPVVDADLDVYINFDNSVLDLSNSSSAEDGAIYGTPTYDDESPLNPDILWTPGNATASSIHISPTTNTSYTYTLTEKLSNSCVQTGSIDVYVTIPNDKDGDGIADIFDLDADNDGILDAIENNCLPVAGFDAHWSLNNSTADVSGNNYNAQSGSNVSFSTVSKEGTHSASFNGTSDYIQYSDGTFLNQAITYFTYSLWIKPTALSGIQTLFEEGGTTNGIAARLNGNMLEAAVREGSTQLNTPTFTFPNDGLWHHIALTYNNGDVILYLDGTPTTTLSTGFDQLAGHSDVQHYGYSNGGAFGASSANYFGGLMDDISHYPIALSQAQINKLVLGCDSDNDGIPNNLDTDSDNDGCSDANEAYGALVDTNGDGTYGGITGSPQVDASGKVLAASYATPATTSGGKYTFQQGVFVAVSTATVNQSVCVGQNAGFSAAATATILTTNPATTANTNVGYQWRVSINNGISYSDISGESGTVVSGATVSLAFANVTADMSGNRYRVKFSNEANICGTNSTAILTVNDIPSITGTTNASSCGTGSVVLRSAASAGTINWYAAPTGGVSLGTGISFITPVLSATTSYWVAATNNSCTTASRTQVTATISTGVVEVSANAGTTFGCYSTLKAAFDKINDGTHQGTISIFLRGNTAETATCLLYNSGNTSGALYNKVTIYPTLPNLKIEGNFSGPLINLNGADSTTIDGRVNQIGSASLTLSNTNTAGQILQFITDATSNTIRYCTIQGVTTSAAGGLVVFGIGDVIGNDNNTIEYCDIRDGATTPANAIYSAGSSVTADNNNNTISNNNIYNYFSATVSSSGIYLASNSSAWTITGNKFYQTATRTTTTTSLTHRAINIATASGINYTISNNIIGFANTAGTGTTAYNGQSTSYRAIELTAGTTGTSSVQGNTISNINFSTTTNTSTLAGIFSGISILAGNVNIGTTSGNTIGSTSGNSAIQVSSTTSLGLINGIYASSTGTVEIKNNTIGSISTNAAATIGFTFNGIYTTGTGGNFNIASNVAGSATTSNSVSIGDGSTTTPVCTLRGIYNTASGIISISGNTVQNCTVNGTGASVLYGIINSGGSGTLEISNNNVISCANTGTGIFVGITNSAVVSTANLNNNIIRNFSKSATAGTFTAISNTGAALSAININGNKLGNSTGGLITYSDANSAALIGISNSGGAASCELSIQNNDIRGIDYTGAAGTNAHTYIVNSATTLKQTISNNTFTNLNVNTNGAIIFIQNSILMPANGIQNIDNNKIVNAFVRNAASTAGAITLFTSSAATNNTNVTVSNNNNDFSNITVSGAATISGWINQDAGTGNVDKTIYNNKFENWTGGSGTITALNVSIVSETNKVYANSIQNISNSQIIYGITCAGNEKIYLNTINNLNSTGGGATAQISGINVTAGNIKSIYQNTISNLTGNSFTTGSVRGILISAVNTVNVYENKIFGISANANTIGTVSGIWVTGGSTVNIDRNKIYDLSSSSASITTTSGVTGCVYGIQVSGNTTSLNTSISNNLIGDLRVTASSGTDLIRGIGLISTGATSTHNIYYNSIYLNAPASAGTNFGTSGIYHAASTVPATATLNLNNNIIINLSTPKGTGTTVAYRRSVGTANTLRNYASTSKNNLFYAGTPGATRLIYSDGTSTAQTLAQFKNGIFTAGTIAPRDQVSVSENLNFISTTGSSNNFLKVNTTIPTQIESGAVNIPDYTLDFLGVIRQGNPGYAGTSTTGPDIGAYENEYVPTDQSPPSITYVPITNNSCLSNKTVTATISDASGVNVTAGTRPRIYFKKLTNNNVLPATNTNTSIGWKYTETSDISNPFTFTIDYNLIFGGVTTGDVIQYFITAQDIVDPSPYVGINTGVFAATPSSAALTSAAFPIGGTTNSFTILAGLSGTVTIGNGGTYTTLTGTGGLFEAINTNGLAGNLTANIISDITVSGATSLNAISYGCAAYYTLTISPGGGARTLSGNVSGSPLLNFNGADYVVIDGLNTGGNSLTISNTSTAATAGTSTIRFLNDATNNIVRNCTIEGSSSLVTSGTVFFSTGASTGNDNNTISNNTIKAAGTDTPANAIYSAGTSVLVDNSEITINNNNIQDYYNPALASNGIYIASNSSAWTITNNKLFQTSTRTATVGNIHRGINIITALGVDYTISNNTIGYTNVASTGTTVYDGALNNRFYPIQITVGILSTSNIQGNKIAGINLSNTVGTAITAAPGIFTGISVLAGKVDIGTTTGNTIGETTGNGSITISSSITGNYIAGIHTTSTGIVNIQNNKIGSISTGGVATIGYTFHGINTVGGGQYTVTDNSIGSITTPNSISIGTSGLTTTGVCTLNGIYNLATGGVTINNNTIQNVASYGTSGSVLTGILNSGISGIVSITNNNIIAATTTGTGLLTGISNTAGATVLTIATNKIRNLTKTIATGAVTAISNTGAVLATITIDGNQLGNTSGDLINYSVANTSTLTGISNTAGSANCAVSIQNNDIKGITYDVASTNANTYIINSAATLSQNISGNTFTALNVNTTGAIVFISNSVIMPVNGVQNVNNNSIVTSFTRIPASGAITLFTSAAATNNSNVTVTNNGNNFSNITVSGAATIAGWLNTDAGVGLVTKTISGNTFSNWTGGTGIITAMNVNIASTANATYSNTISNISSVGNIYGIITGAGNDNIYSNTINNLVSSGTVASVVNGIAITTTGISKNIYQNTIYNLQANNITTGSVSGIAVTGGSNNSIYRNKIYDISSSGTGITSGTVNGILISGTVADLITTIHNNRIGNLSAPAANVINNVRGISIANTGLRSATNVYFNTVYINTSSTGTNFGSSGIYHVASAILSTGSLNLRNNIIVNLSAPNGTGLTVAFRQSSGTASVLKNYNTLSNNNLFYAGVPAATNLIYSNGVNSAIDIAAYKAGNFTAGIISPRDQLSISENPQFISTVGSSPDFLKISDADITFIESGAVNISGITTDFDGLIRAGNPGYPVQVNGAGTAPDIGSEEFDGKLPNVTVAGANTLSNGSYAKVAGAFTAINAYDQTAKDIVVTIIGNTSENTTATLNQGAWTSLKVYPTKTGLSISGNIAGNPVINLDGADNVTIDGRVNQTGSTKSLSIINSSTSANAGTSSIHFSNSAEFNTLKYLNIYGSSISVTDGIIVFASSASGNGNDNNIIEYCAVSNVNGNRPVNSIYSLGSLGSDNSTNTIRYTTVSDFINNTASSNGINLGAHSSAWTLTNNSFYETTNFIPAVGTFVYTAISIDNTTGNNFTVSNNYIGGKSALCAGDAWNVNANTNHSFRAIYLNVGTVAASSVQSNTIRNFLYTTSSVIPWRAIDVNAGNVNIGTVTGNIIGASASTSSISVTSTSNAQTYGIYVGSAGAIYISKNNIGSIAVYGNSTNVSHSFAGIYKKPGIAGAMTVSYNVIGSTTTTNSISAASTASTASVGQNLIGIFNESTGTNSTSYNTIVNLNNSYDGTNDSRTAGIYATAGSSTLTKNTIYNLSSAAAGTGTGTVSGVEMNGTNATNTVTETVIYNLSNTNTGFAGSITGIYFTGGTGANLVNRNFIRSLSVHASSTNASIYGIRMIQGTTTFANNIISLGGNTATTIYGIYSSGASGSNSSVYFNTVYISGTPGSGITNKSYAFYEAANANTRDLRNNIFSNFRSTTGGSSLHYALYLNYSGVANLTLDYNNYWASGVGGIIGYYNGTDVNTVPVVSLKDANSIKGDPVFANGGGIAASDYKVTTSSAGTTGTGIALDYAQTARGVPPSMGAWEYNTNSWLGTVSTDFNNPANWSAGAVPLEEASIVFAATPLRDCILDQDRTVGNIVNNQPTYKFNINGKQLTVQGGLYLTAGGQIDATAAGSALVFEGDEAQTIPDGAFVSNVIPNLIVNNIYGVTTNSDLSITEILNLAVPNPSDTKGCLETGTKTITMGSNAVTTGDGDATGIVSRTIIAANKIYTFGNQDATVYFANTGTLPTSVSVKMTIGIAPTWKPGAVNRVYDIIQTGANPLNPTNATITSAYLDSELNGNNEERLVNISYRNPPGMLFEHGRASIDTIENWLKLTNVNMAFFPSAFGSLQIGIDEAVLETLTWNGSASTSWTTVNNWTPMGAPSDFVNIIIPDAATTANDPVIPPATTIKSLKLMSGSILNSMPDAQMTIVSGANAWVNEGGTLNPNTSTVIFTGDSADISGATSFYNVKIESGAKLIMKEGSTMRIVGVMNNIGIWQTTTGGNTSVEYNGGDQTVVVPNPSTNRYSNLILSGSGVKTMPSLILSVLGDLTLSGSASATALNNLVIGGNLTIGANAAFNANAKTHTIGGNLVHDGSFLCFGSVFMFTGISSAQSISGAGSSTNFCNVIILNPMGVNCTKNIAINTTLDLQADNPTDFIGSLNMDINTTLTLNQNAVTTGPGDVTGIVKRAHTFVTDQPYTFGNRNTILTFSADGTKPTEVSIKTSIGNAPLWKPTAIKRIYDFSQSGGSGNFVNVQVNYLDTELNGAQSDEIVYFGASGFPTPTVVEWGFSERDENNYWLLLSNVNVALWPTAFGQMEITLAETQHPTLTWNGSQSTDWNNVYNWTPLGFPNKFSRLIIPDATTTANDALLPLNAEAHQLIIQNKGILNSIPGAGFRLYNPDGDIVWQNNGGTFNAGTSIVEFSDLSQRISGSTDFYNVSILTDATLTPETGTRIGIAGILVNDGTLNATANSNTIEYNGTAQTIILPNGVIPGYYSLTLSGNGIKTLPPTIMHYYGNLSVQGTAQATFPDDVTIDGSLSIGSNAILNTDDNYITIGGNIIHNGSFNIGSSTIELAGNAAQLISGTASSTVFNALLIHQSYGVNSTKNITVNSQLDLLYANPAATYGLLNMNTYTLDRGPLGYTTGPGDVTGIIRRTTIIANTIYSFGNRNATITFNNAGTIPTEISVRVSIGTAPAWRPGAVKRVYEFIQSGANPLDPTQATIHSAYLDSELNGNEETRLVNFSYRTPPGMLLEHGRSANNTTENWLELSNVNMAFFPSVFGSVYITMDESEIENLTWNGSISSSWTTVDNWTPNGSPSSSVNVTIPDVSGFNFTPYLNYTSEVKTMTIQSGGVLNSISGSTLNVYGGIGAWSNNGTFNPANTTVIFNSSESTIAGTTNFQQLSIASAAALTPLSGNIMRIADVLTNNGILHAAANSNSIEYNGSNQTVIIPNGTIPGYYSLTLSGSGTKTMPAAVSSILGDFSLSGTASATATVSLTIGGTLSVGSTASFTTGAYTHSIGGNFVNDGGFTASASNTIVMNGTGAQTIGGTVAPLLKNLTITNTGGTVTATTSLDCNGNFTNSGVLDLTNHILTVSNTINNIGTLLTAVPALQSLTPIPSGKTWGGTVVYNALAVQTVVPGNYTNLTLKGSDTKTIPISIATISGSLSLNESANTTTSSDLIIGANLNITNTAILTVSAGKQLTVTGITSNTTGNAGLILKSDITGTSSLLHNSNNVPATVERYISGAAEAWHFISSPISTQSISGSWLPSGTYGNGTGYDLYAWNEPTNCWIYKLNTTSTVNWNTIHPGSNFVVGRGYLYSVQALNPTKTFTGNLNNGTFSIPISTAGTDATLKGFNLVGNPYPSSVDWTASSGWSRSDLTASDIGYDMWIWNPTAKNYGVCNSATGFGTNGVTQYIAPMQGFFVQAATAGSLGMDNNIRTHGGAGNWFKKAAIDQVEVSLKIISETDNTSDEALLLFGSQVNETGAAKLFSHVLTAPSLYLHSGGNEYSVRYLTDTLNNPTVPVMFKPGQDGTYTISCNFKVNEFDLVTLEDRQMQYSQDMKSENTYHFIASKKDDANRFVLHFATEKKNYGNKLPAQIYANGQQLIIDLSSVQNETSVMIYDLLGRLIVQKRLQGSTQHKLKINLPPQVLIVKLINPQGYLTRKVYNGNNN